MVQYHEINQRLSSVGTQIDAAPQFHDAADALREPYLGYVYDLGLQANSLRWWLTSTSFRSPYASKTYSRACWLNVALNLIDSWNSPDLLVLLVPDKLLRRAIRINRPGNAQEQIWVTGASRFSPFKPLRDTVKILVRRAFFILRETRRLILARRTAPSRTWPTGPATLVISSVSHRSVHLAEDFHRYYFGDLAGQLKKLGCHVAVMPIILRPVNYKQALEGLRDSQVPVVVPHRYLRLADLLRAAVSTVPPIPVSRSIPSFSGMDISLLVKEEISDYRVANWAADALLMWALVRRWADMGLSISRIIYVYENQPWERALCSGARQFLPGTAMVGYQHSRAPMQLLSFYLASGGELEAPLPDRVVTVGAHTAKLLATSGYKPGQVRVGGALQRQGVPTPSHVPENGSKLRSRPTVLITCSNGLEESGELAHMAANLFTGDEGIRLIIKFHPGMPFSRVKEVMHAQFPAHVDISEEPLERLMSESSVMIYSGSTVCIDALAVGLPVIHLKPRFDLDLDPLGSASEFALQAVGIEDLREKVLWLLDHRAEYISEHQADWLKLVGEMYGPVNQQTYAAFVDAN